MHRDRATALYFSKAAPYYHSHAELHKDIARRLVAMLPDFNPLRIMDLGCGTGFLAARLAERWPAASLDALDFAPGMLTVGRARWTGHAKITWHLSDIFDFAPESPYDLIASSSTLQWLRPFDRLFARLREMLAPGGRLAGAVFLDGTLAELLASRRRAAPLKPITGRLPGFDEIASALADRGLRLIAGREQTRTERYSGAADFLQFIKRLGFTGGPLSAAPHALSPAEIRKLASCYQEQFGQPDGSVIASYKVLYFMAEEKTVSDTDSRVVSSWLFL